MPYIRFASDFKNVKDFYIYFDIVNEVFVPNWQKTLEFDHNKDMPLSNNSKDKLYIDTQNGFKIFTKLT